MDGTGSAVTAQGFVLATSLGGTLASIYPATGADVLSKLQEKFPASAGFAVGVFMDEASLQDLQDPASLLQKHTSILVLSGSSLEASKLHHLRLQGRSYDLLEYTGVAGDGSVRLIIADSYTQASPKSLSLKEIHVASSTPSTQGIEFVTTQSYTFGTTLKTIGKVAEVTGVAAAVTRTIGSLPFDLGVYDAAAFEGSTGAGDAESYHVTLVRFFSDQNRELPELSQYPYTLAAHDVMVKGFLVPLPAGAEAPNLDSLADEWVGRQDALRHLSEASDSPIAGFAAKDLFTKFSQAAGSHHHARAVLVVTDVELAPAAGLHRLRDITASTFSAPVTHTQIEGFAAPAGAGSVLLDFTISNGQPKIYQLGILGPGISGPVKVDGLVVNTAAQEAAVTSVASDVLAQNPWAAAIAADVGNATWASALVTQSAVLYPYQVTPAGLDGKPLPMLLSRTGNLLSWTPTIADGFTRYEVRQSPYVATAASDGTLLATITSKDSTSYTLAGDAKWYYTVWAFNDKGSAPSNPVYVQPAASVSLTGVTYCTSNIRQCLQVSWSQHSGSDFERYELYRRTSGSSGWTLAQTITQSGTVSAADNGLTCGTTYEYKVTLWAGGKSADSNVLSGNPNNGYGFCDQPSTTLNSVVYCSTNQKTCLHASWSPYSGQGFEKYELQRRVGTTGEWSAAAIITDAATTSYSDNGLTCGTTYNYRVVLFVAGGSSESNVLAGNPNNGFGGCF